MTDEIFEPIKLPDITSHASRVVDMMKMRASLSATPAHIITDIMIELNVRMTQYEAHYKSDTFDFLIIQTIQDYRKHIRPCYETDSDGKLLRTRPVGIIVADNRPIYANPSIIRSDFENGIIMLFVNSIDAGE